MKTFIKLNYAYFALPALLIASLACSLFERSLSVGRLRTETEEVELGGADEVEVRIEITAGELTIDGGADALLEADFAYNVEELKPEVDFDGNHLTVLTPDVGESGIRGFSEINDYRYEWDLRLNNDVPMEMSVEIGAGFADLELSDLMLSTLDLQAGAGEVILDLSNNPSLSRLIVEAGVGELTIDLSGVWEDNLDVTIATGVGRLTLILPQDVGVRVDVEGGLTNIDAHGFNRDGDRYVNDAFGESEITIRVNIQAGLGDIHLELGS